MSPATIARNPMAATTITSRASRIFRSFDVKAIVGSGETGAYTRSDRFGAARRLVRRRWRAPGISSWLNFVSLSAAAGREAAPSLQGFDRGFRASTASRRPDLLLGLALSDAVS